MDAVPDNICERFYAVVLVCFNGQTSWRMNHGSLTVYHQLNRTGGQNRQVVEFVFVLHKNMPRRNASFLGIYSGPEVMMDHVISRPLMRTLTPVALLAMMDT